MLSSSCVDAIITTATKDRERGGRMARHHLAWLLLVTWLCATGCGMCTCASTSDEQQIRALIDEGARAAERHDLSGVMELATDDLRVMPERLGRTEVMRLLLYFFQRFGEFGLHYPPPWVEHEPGASEATATVLLLLVRKGEAAPDLSGIGEDPASWAESAADFAHLARLRLSLTKHDGAWRVDAIKVESFRGFGFE
jgi:hypothetical protein